MNRIVVLLMAVFFIFAACAPQQPPERKPISEEKLPQRIDIAEQTPGGRIKASEVNDVNFDINAVDIQDDVNLTKRAEKRDSTEKDVLVNQQVIDQNRAQLEQGKFLTVENCPHGTNKNTAQCEVLKVPVVQSFKTAIPQGIRVNLKYTQYPTALDYLLVVGSNINVRSVPKTDAQVISKAQLFQKINVLQQVKGEYLNKFASDVWYRVFWKENNDVRYGFLFGYSVNPRSFQLEKMAQSINALKEETSSNQMAYISNYKNYHGMAPAYQGKDVDKYGTLRSQAAPVYNAPDINAEFRYMTDGTIVSVLGENKDFYKVRALSFPGEYWVPRRYVSFDNYIKDLTKVIVVDRKNQNEGVFEYIDGVWNLISYTFATTGVNDEYRLETPLGYYQGIEKKERFLYLDDITKEISGYAPWAIRFSGGGYIHGVPITFIKEDGEYIDPGMQEYLYTIGTTPRSHKCVRNYTSHAKFLYDWFEPGKTAVIVIE